MCVVLKEQLLHGEEAIGRCPAFALFFLKSYHPNKNRWEPDVKIESDLFTLAESVIKMLIRCFDVYCMLIFDSVMCFLLYLTVASIGWCVSFRSLKSK